MSEALENLGSRYTRNNQMVLFGAYVDIWGGTEQKDLGWRFGDLDIGRITMINKSQVRMLSPGVNVQ